jgi:hypothetical protein
MSHHITVEPYDDIVTVPFSNGAIVRRDFPGFDEDYLVIHCLIRKYGPSRLMEIGTSSGYGTNVICKAMGLRRLFPSSEKMVFSIDVPPGTDSSILYPDKEDGHPPKAGVKCKYRYTQIFGDSYNFDFSPYYPLDAWFIDGKHNYRYAENDTLMALQSKPSLIIWHDLQIAEVEEAVCEAMGKHSEYTLRRAGTTRVGYAVKAAD